MAWQHCPGLADTAQGGLQGRAPLGESGLLRRPCHPDPQAVFGDGRDTHQVVRLLLGGQTLTRNECFSRLLLWFVYSSLTSLQTITSHLSGCIYIFYCGTEAGSCRRVKAPFHFCHSPASASSETLESESGRGPLAQLMCGGVWMGFSWVIASHTNGPLPPTPSAPAIPWAQREKVTSPHGLLDRQRGTE